MLEQTVHRFFSRGGRDVEGRKPGLRDEVTQSLSFGPARPGTFALADERLIRLGCPPEKIRINRTGIPLAAIPLGRREAPTDGRWRFLQACRLIPKKGLTTCLRAFAIFQRENPGAELLIAGKGPLQPVWRPWPRTWGWGSMFTSPGSCRRRICSSYITAVTFFSIRAKRRRTKTRKAFQFHP